MVGDPDDIDPEAVLERRERRVSRQGHAAVAGALATTALSTAALALAIAVGALTPRALLPVFSLAGLGALAGAWLNGALVKRTDDSRPWFRRGVGVVLAAAAALSAAVFLLGNGVGESVQLLVILFGVAWLAGAAVTWRFR
ncbi:hypothetical protein [Halobaculum litoreum]|uniref:Uncharacterized protein n=1 Tax=Halobaculum litoreum TaxID=3031998 RepID=A0ABD5XLI0_9EURY|nr:hypothetical protein [Halobaculum sp. DT92]